MANATNQTNDQKQAENNEIKALIAANNTQGIVSSKIKTLKPLSPCVSVDFHVNKLNKDGDQKQSLVKTVISLDTVIGGDNLYQFTANLWQGDKATGLFTFTIAKNYKATITSLNGLAVKNGSPIGKYDGCQSGYELFLSVLDNIENTGNYDLGYLLFTEIINRCDFDQKNMVIADYSPKTLKDSALAIKDKVTIDNLPLFALVNSLALSAAK